MRKRRVTQIPTHVRVERYKAGRHWAVWDRTGLVVVALYKRGAVSVAERLKPRELGAKIGGRVWRTSPR